MYVWYILVVVWVHILTAVTSRPFSFAGLKTVSEVSKREIENEMNRLSGSERVVKYYNKVAELQA